MPNLFKVGSCGTLMPGAERLIESGDVGDVGGNGEVLFRGRHVMMGYLRNPEKTQVVKYMHVFIDSFIDVD